MRNQGLIQRINAAIACGRVVNQCKVVEQAREVLAHELAVLDFEAFLADEEIRIVQSLDSVIKWSHRPGQPD